MASKVVALMALGGLLMAGKGLADGDFQASAVHIIPMSSSALLSDMAADMPSGDAAPPSRAPLLEYRPVTEGFALTHSERLQLREQIRQAAQDIYPHGARRDGVGPLQLSR